MPKFRVCAFWEMCNEWIVEAETLEEAISKVEDDVDGEYSLEDNDPEYVDGSFQINKESCGNVKL